MILHHYTKNKLIGDSKGYRESNIESTIRITISQKRSIEEENILNEFLSFLKSENKLQHSSVIMADIAENGVILDDEWRKGF